MTRFQLEHVIRAAGTIADVEVIIVIGTAALLASFPNPPDDLCMTQDVDLYPRDDPALADIIDGSIGEGSLFHEQFHVYSHASGPDATNRLPSNWQNRLIAIGSRGGITGLCLHPVDLAAAKLLAGRDKDFAFVRGMLQNQMVGASDIRQLLQELPDHLAAQLAENLQLCLARATAMDDASVPRDDNKRKSLDKDGGIGC